MTTLQDTLNDMEEKAKKATPGKWTTFHPKLRYCANDIAAETRGGEPFVLAQMNRNMENWKEDASYIAACSPDTVLALITALREAHEHAVEHVSNCFDMRCGDCKMFGSWLAKYGAKAPISNAKGEK